MVFPDNLQQTISLLYKKSLRRLPALAGALFLALPVTLCAAPPETPADGAPAAAEKASSEVKAPETPASEGKNAAKPEAKPDAAKEVKPDAKDADKAETKKEGPDGKEEKAKAKEDEKPLSEAEAKKKAEEAKLPKTPLTSKLLYSILSSEIAYQRGEDAYAFRTMADSAKQSKDPRLARRAAEMSVKHRNVQNAIEATQIWHDLVPDSEEAEKFMLGFLVMDGRLKDVREYYERKLQETPHDKRGVIFFQMQQILAGCRDKTAAFAVLEATAANYQDVPGAHIAISVTALMMGDRQKAKEAAGKALEIKPDSATAVLAYAQAESSMAEASAILSDYLEKYPDSREVRISLARLLLAQKKHESARREFRTLLEADPKDLLALYSLGLLAVQEENYKVAEEYLLKYLEIADAAGKDAGREDVPKDAASKENAQESVQALFLLSQLAEENGNYEKALQWLDKIKVDEDDEAQLDVQVRRALVYARMGQLDRAKSIISELMNENPYEQERLALAEAQILRSVKKIQEAYEVLKAASAAFPKNTTILYDYALTAENLGLYATMEESLKKIMAMDPRHQQAFNALGYSLADRNIRLDEAYELISKALQMAPADPYITDSMGWVLFRQGKLDEAEAYLRRAYEMREEAEIAIHLAEVLWEKGEKEEAVRFLMIGKKKDPESSLIPPLLHRMGIRLD